MKLEALKKLCNVDIRTAHSLAFKYVVVGNNLEINSNDYRNSQLANILGIRN